ncbi:MAG TPA: PEP-CTERM sorting domain-containing protein [Deltaproteobacteria bacterium]|nr:PEP-CTERM sorting domain-containing protein [Deltaproteobacteria bacterium]HOI07541.1 PEP-CTERM sorting domain-containing protein [Deltaproteobacteria bacterium]
MRVSLTIFTLAVLALVSNAAPAQLILFEDLAPADPPGSPVDGWGTVSDGYRGHGWYEGQPAALALAWPEGHACMPGIGTAPSEDSAPAPVPEPSTLLILGAGILGFTRLYRRFTMPRHTDLM